MFKIDFLFSIIPRIYDIVLKIDTPTLWLWNMLKYVKIC